MSRTRRTLSIAALAVAVAALAAAAPYARTQLSLQDESKLWFDGTSTVRAFSCSATKLNATVVIDAAGINTPAEKLVQSAELIIPVAELDCRNGTMNGHMRTALNANAHPRITWRMVSYRVLGDSVVISGRLTINGKENPLEMRSLGAVTGGVLRVKGSREIRMTDYGVKPPSLMMGTMKVGDVVIVKYDLALGQ